MQRDVTLGIMRASETGEIGQKKSDLFQRLGGTVYGQMQKCLLLMCSDPDVFIPPRQKKLQNMGRIGVQAASKLHDIVTPRSGDGIYIYPLIQQVLQYLRFYFVSSGGGTEKSDIYSVAVRVPDVREYSPEALRVCLNQFTDAWEIVLSCPNEQRKDLS